MVRMEASSSGNESADWLVKDAPERGEGGVISMTVAVESGKKNTQTA